MANTDDELYSDLASAEAQRALLIAIFKFYVAEKKSPTYRELAKLMARTISTIHRAARELRTKGYIDEDPESSRAEARNIVLTEYAVGWLKFIGHDVTDYLEATTIKDLVRAIPVLGEIAAGNPILTEGNVESYVPDAVRGLGAVRLEIDVTLALGRLALPRVGLPGDRDKPGPGHRVVRGREPGAAGLAGFSKVISGASGSLSRPGARRRGCIRTAC